MSGDQTPPFGRPAGDQTPPAGRPAGDRVRALVVDDTALYRSILSEALVASGAEVVGTAPNGRFALARLARTEVDLMLLDVEMPELDGLGTLAEVRKLASPPTVVMISGQTTRSTRSTIDALANGALDFIRKPDHGSPAEAMKALVEALRPLVRHVQLRRNLRLGAPSLTRQPAAVALPSLTPAPTLPPNATSPPLSVRSPVAGEPGATPRRGPPASFAAVAIGISTGGPNALGEMIPHLPADLPVPVLVVQHMPPGFTHSLAEHLARRSAIVVREAADGEPLRAGTVYIAPGGRHMVLRRLPAGGLIVGVNDQPPVNCCRPSVDVLLRSMAANVEGPVLAAIMTGMGNDGCEGVRSLKRQGGYCLSQTASSCVVYGMPLAVDEAGLSDEHVSLDQMASRVARLVRRRVNHGA